MEISESRKLSWRKSLTHQIFHKVCPHIFFTIVSVLLTLRSKSICSHIPSMGSGFYIWVGFELPSILIYTDLSIRPIIGGVLSHPADRWPGTLGKFTVFRRYPYFLPCLAAALIPLSGFVFASLFLKEVTQRLSLLHTKQALICFG
jgi:hypothetical protein